MGLSPVFLLSEKIPSVDVAIVNWMYRGSVKDPFPLSKVESEIIYKHYLSLTWVTYGFTWVFL